MEEISLTQEEKELLDQSKTLTEIVFCYRKYRTEDASLLDRFPNLSSFMEYVNTDHAKNSEREEHCKYKDYKDTLTSHYKNTQEKLANIRKIFKISQKADPGDYCLPVFWYELICRINSQKKIWNVIPKIKNHNQTGFVDAYKKNKIS